MFKHEETQIRQVRKLHCKYASMLFYIALLNKEIAKRSAKLEELRKKKEKKREPQNDRLNGLNFHTVIIDEIAGNAKIGETKE